LYEFFKKGFEAFTKMDGAETLIRAVEIREMRILDQIYSAEADPFIVQ
jgi:hypothetical protein